MTIIATIMTKTAATTGTTRFKLARISWIVSSLGISRAGAIVAVNNYNTSIQYIPVLAQFPGKRESEYFTSQFPGNCKVLGA